MLKIRRRIAVLVLTMAAVLALTPVALAYPSAYDTSGGCTIRVRAFEHFTRARHEMEDQTIGCGNMRMRGVRRCLGMNRVVDVTTGANYIDRKYTSCDAINTEGWSSGGTYAKSGV